MVIRTKRKNLAGKRIGGDFYKILVQELGESYGIEPNDIMISIVTNGETDWSFGLGEAQF